MGNIESIERAVLRASKKVSLAVGIAGIAYAANFGVAKPVEATPPCPTPAPVGKGTLPSSKDCQPSVATSSVITSTVKSEVLPSAPILPSGTTIKQEQNVNVNLPEGFVLRPGTFAVTREELDQMVKGGVDSALKARGATPPEIITRVVTSTVTVPGLTEYRFNEGYPWEPGYPWRVAALWGAIGAVAGAFSWSRIRRTHLPHHHEHTHNPPAGGVQVGP